MHTVCTSEVIRGTGEPMYIPVTKKIIKNTVTIKCGNRHFFSRERGFPGVGGFFCPVPVQTVEPVVARSICIYSQCSVSIRFFLWTRILGSVS